MTEQGTEVAYRNGKVLAAYLHLAHSTGQKPLKGEATMDGLLVVDFGSAGSRSA